MDSLIRWKTKKPIERANQQMSEAQSLFHIHRGEIDSSYHTIIEDQLLHADELRQGLDGPTRWVHIEQSRQYCEQAGKVLDKVKGMLVPDPDENQPPQQSN